MPKYKGTHIRAVGRPARPGSIAKPRGSKRAIKPAGPDVGSMTNTRRRTLGARRSRS